MDPKGPICHLCHAITGINIKIVKIKRKYFYIYNLRYLIWAGDKDDGRACAVAALGVQSCKAALSNGLKASCGASTQHQGGGCGLAT